MSTNQIPSEKGLAQQFPAAFIPLSICVNLCNLWIHSSSRARRSRPATMGGRLLLVSAPSGLDPGGPIGSNVGATWIVDSVVFAAILVMILASDLYVLAVKPRRLGPYYALLVAALLAD
jgi:hypothetical protein